MNYLKLRNRAITTIAASLPLLFLTGCPADKKCPPQYVSIASASTPIKGAGGAFTVISEGKWTETLPKDATSWCTSFDSTTLPANAPVISDGFSSDLPSPFTGPWLIYGHLSDYSGKPSGSGLKLEIDTSKNCDGKAGTSVIVTIINPTKSNYVKFYDKSLPHRVATHDDKRFKDNDPTQGCDKEEDLCERVADINIGGVDYTCIDGDCNFAIGKQDGISRQ